MKTNNHNLMQYTDYLKEKFQEKIENMQIRDDENRVDHAVECRDS